MPRPPFAVLLLTALLAAVAVAAPASAATPDRCRPHHGEHTLARSAQAVVLARLAKDAYPYPRQTLTGCSRATGKRRTIAVIERGPATENVARPTRLIGLRLAGTRVAYLAVNGDGRKLLIADDALHGGRRHDLSTPPYGATTWPFDSGSSAVDPAVEWALDAQGDVAWITTETRPNYGTVQTLGVWRAGLGRRSLDAHAVLGGVSLRDGVVRWRRNGQPRQVDLTAVPASRCAGGDASTVGTLEVDVTPARSVRPFTACLRATGRTVTGPNYAYEPEVADVNGPYVVLVWQHVELWFGEFYDLARGTYEVVDGVHPGAVVDEHGSLAWPGSGLWVRDAGGTRKVADRAPGVPYGPLYRDGSTVTWPGGGPTVTLNP